MSRSSEMSVVLPAALHARPAGAVVRAVAAFSAEVEVRHGERSASARSALRLMSLGAPAGAVVLVHGVGEDAEAAVAAVAAALAAAT